MHSPPQNPEPETRTLRLKGAGKELYKYKPQEVLYEQGACNNILCAFQAALSAYFPDQKSPLNPQLGWRIDSGSYIEARGGWNESRTTISTPTGYWNCGARVEEWRSLGNSSRWVLFLPETSGLFLPVPRLFNRVHVLYFPIPIRSPTRGPEVAWNWAF